MLFILTMNNILNNTVLSSNSLLVLCLFSHNPTYFILAIHALLTARLSCCMRQTTAGRRWLSVPVLVPFFVPKPGEGHAGRDGGQGFGRRQVPSRLLQ